MLSEGIGSGVLSKEGLLEASQAAGDSREHAGKLCP
jgi:hypothetical protein